MDFHFYPLRFEFLAKEPVQFPPGVAANVLRGALGVTFRRIACTAECREPDSCAIRASCLYARTFEPVSFRGHPSGLADWPRPFVFRARHLNGQTIATGESFFFDLHVFSLDRGVLEGFIRTFAALAREGLGPRRGKAELQRVQRLPVAGLAAESVYDGATHRIAGRIEPVALSLDPPAHAPDRVKVEFLSPTELKHKGEIAALPGFGILFGRIRDRIGTLRELYGEGALAIDYLSSNARAATIMLTSHRLQYETSKRFSTRTGRSHPLGGFVGTAEYQGDLAEFLPYLQIAAWTGVGRQCVWGKGELRIEAILKEE